MSGSSALHGVRILDLSEVMQGPFATQALADFGADVVKIERPGRGDVMRSLDRHAAERGLASSYFVAVNRNKRSVCLDLKSVGGREMLKRMAASADVLVHNYRPGVMERLGLGYDDLAAINPRLIYAIAMGFGESGPLASKAGQDLVGQSISGIAMQRPSPDLPPYLHPIPFIDYAGGMSLAQGILIALLERRSSGQGQKVSISLFDTAVAMQTLEATSHLMYHEETNWVSDHFPNATFETRDGWIAVLGFFRENPLRLICEALEIDDLSQDACYATPELQREHKQELNRVLAEQFARRTCDECIERLERVDILCAPVLALPDVLEHPQVRYNGLLVDVDVGGQDEARTIGNPVKLSRTRATVRRSVPLLGEHTRDVLREMGLGDAELDALGERGAAFGVAPPDLTAVTTSQHEARREQ